VCMQKQTHMRRDFAFLKSRRMKAAKLYEQGETQAAVHHRLRVSRTTAQRWYEAWRVSGQTGLQGEGRAGRKPRLTALQLKKVAQALLQGPQAFGYANELWTLPRVAKAIEKITQVSYHPGHVWRVLRQMDWSLQRPVSRARERNEKKIRAWVSKEWLRIKKKPAV